MNKCEIEIRNLLDRNLQHMIERKELPESCVDVKYDVWYDKKRECYTTNFAFVMSKHTYKINEQ